MSITAASIVAKVSLDGVTQAQAGLLSLGESADAAHTAMAGLVVGGLALAGGALIALGALSVKSAGDFQESMTRLVTSAGEVGSNLPMISAGILKMSVDTATSTAQLAAGMYFVESAGNHGAAALDVLGVAARGAKSENADLDTVARALTTTMTDYHMPVSMASSAMNGLIITVQNGKTTLQELAASMGQVLPIASSMHISFPQVAGAIDTMTNAGMPAEQAAQNLAHVLTALEAPSKVAITSMTGVGLSAQQVKDTLVNQGLPQALQLIEDHVGKQFPAGSVQGETALKNIMGGLVGLKLSAQLTGDSLATTEANIAKITAGMKGGGDAVLGWDLVQGNFNFKMDQARMAIEAVGIKIGTLLLPVLGQILDKVTPVLTAFGNWATSGHAVSDMLNFFHANAQILIPILAGLGGILVAVIVPAMAALAISVIAATWPFLLIGLAIAGLTALFMHFYTSNAPFRDFINGLGKDLQQVAATVAANFVPTMQKIGTILQTDVLPVFEKIGAFIAANFLPTVQKIGTFFQTVLFPAFQQLGSFLSSVFMPVFQQVGGIIATAFVPVWQQLVATFNTQLLPAWNQLVKAFQPAIPFFQLLGAILGVLLVVAIGVLIGVLAGLAKGIAGALTGIIQIVGGIVQLLSGMFTTLLGIIGFFCDLFTGKWSKLGADLGNIWQGVVTSFTGMWNVIAGIFNTFVGFISGIVSGFTDTIIGFFTHLWNTLVGHSIIPDMINSIISYFQQLPGRVLGFIEGLVSSAINTFNAWKSAAIDLIVSMINLIVSTLQGLPGKAADAFNLMVSTAKNILNGLVGDALNIGSNIVHGIATGITNAIGSVGDAIGSVTNFISSHLPHSPAKIGPLKDLVLQGSLISDQIGQGMLSKMPQLQTSMNVLLKPISAPSTGGSFGSGGGSQYQFSPIGGGAPNIYITVQPNDLNVDGRQLAKTLLPHTVAAIRNATGVRGL